MCFSLTRVSLCASTRLTASPSVSAAIFSPVTAACNVQRWASNLFLKYTPRVDWEKWPETCLLSSIRLSSPSKQSQDIVGNLESSTSLGTKSNYKFIYIFNIQNLFTFFLFCLVASCQWQWTLRWQRINGGIKNILTYFSSKICEEILSGLYCCVSQHMLFSGKKCLTNRYSMINSRIMM